MVSVSQPAGQPANRSAGPAAWGGLRLEAAAVWRSMGLFSAAVFLLVFLPGSFSSSPSAPTPSGEETWNWKNAIEGLRLTSPPCPADSFETIKVGNENTSGVSREQLRKGLETFSRCGLLVVENAFPSDILEQFSSSLSSTLEPHLRSRERVRLSLKDAVKTHKNLRRLWEDSDIRGEPVFARIDSIRERNDGRIDLSLPWDEPPFFSVGLLQSPAVAPFLEALLGVFFKLHSVHGVVALPGTGNQHWHRDDELLYGESEPRGLPPYAIDVFLPLTDFFGDAKNGPTEFLLGSHLATSRAGKPDTAMYPTHLALYNPGTAIIADVRTFHRGRANSGRARRDLGMLIFCRRWWHDFENYNENNLGGFSRARKHDPLSPEGKLETVTLPLSRDWSQAPKGYTPTEEEKRRVFFGLVNRWQKGIFSELDREFQQASRTDL